MQTEKGGVATIPPTGKPVGFLAADIMTKYKKLSSCIAIALSLSLMLPAMPFVYADDPGSETSSGSEETGSSDPGSGSGETGTSDSGSGGSGNSGGSGGIGGLGDMAKNNPALAAQMIMGVTGGIPVPGANAKYSFVNMNPDAKVFPICTGTKTPTQNEKASYKCVIVGEKAFGAGYVSGTVKGGEQELEGVGMYQYKKLVGKEWKSQTGMMKITVTVNGYKGETAMSGASPYDSYSSDNNVWGTSGDGEVTKFGNGGDDGIDYTATGEEILPTGTDICPDGTYACNTTGTDTLFSPVDTGTDLFPSTDTGSGTGFDPFVDNTNNGTGGTGFDPFVDDTNNGTGGTGGTNIDPWGTGGSGSGKGTGTGTGAGSGGSGSGSGDPWSSNGIDGTDGTSGSNGTNGSDGSNGSNGGYYPYDHDSDDNYGNLIDDLLGDNNGYNSGDSDWAGSGNGDDGYGNLDDYFNSIGDSDSLPDGLTDDILGVDSDLMKPVNNTGYNVGDPVDLDGDGVPDGIAVDVDGDGIPDGVDVDGDGIPDYPLPGAAASIDTNSVSADEYSDGNSGYSDSSYPEAAGDDGEFIEDSSGSLQDLFSAMDGMTEDSSGGDASLSGINGEGSLAERLERLMGKSDTASGNPDSGITEQEMFDIAKKMLLANGMSLEDIARGKNYDKGSAYTEPAAAWDMNRITTLLRARKIKLDNGDIKPQAEKNSLTSASSRSKSASSASK